MVAETTNITLSFPNWFYVVFSFGVIAFIFLAGGQYTLVRRACKKIPRIHEALIMISLRLYELKIFKKEIYISNTSPLSLTGEGKKMLKESGFDEFFQANKKTFYTYITSHKPLSPYDVDRAARMLAFDLDFNEMKKTESVKDFAYNAGRPIMDILYAYAIEIRDRYLKEIGLSKADKQVKHTEPIPG